MIILSGQATIQHIALEGRCYYINCDQFFTKDMYPADLHAQDEVAKLPELVCRGGSCVLTLRTLCYGACLG